MIRRTIQAASQLIDNGLPFSAGSLLGTLPIHNHEINSLKAKARRMSEKVWIEPGIYALAAYHGTGVVVPLRAEIGSPSSGSLLERDAQAAIERAAEIARDHVRPADGGLPSLRLVLPSMVTLFGESLALPAALAFLEKWSGRRATVPVLATGRLSAMGRVLPVGDLELKTAAALGELGDSQGLVLIPLGGGSESMDRAQPFMCVGSLREAIAAVWGDSETYADPGLLSVSDLLQRAGKETDPARALSILESYDLTHSALVDKALVLFRMGTCSRHLGDTDKAVELHEHAMRLCSRREKVLGREVFEALEMEKIATDVDCYVFEVLEKQLRERLRRPFLSAHNEVRCRGILAQVLSTTGRCEEAIPLREENLHIQEENEAMRREIPRTLACLVHEAARARKADIFDRCAAALLEKAPPEADEQDRYNARALSLGLILLDRHDDLLRWVRGEKMLWGKDPPRQLVRLMTHGTKSQEYPEVATTRALARALRRSGAASTTVALCNRVEKSTDPTLVQWLAHLTHVEGALADFDLGRRETAAATLSSLARPLSTLHRGAARFHSSLVRLLLNEPLSPAIVVRIENEIDDVYY